MLLALFLAVLIVRWLATWYRQHPEKQIVVDPLQWVWDVVDRVTQRLWWKTADTSMALLTGTTTVHQKPVIAAVLHPDFSTGMILPEQMENLYGQWKRHGAVTASLLLLQWCDFDSTYCIQGYEEGALFQYLEKYPNDLAYQLKSYLRTNDTQHMLQHQAAQCAEQLASHEQFLWFYFSLYQSRGAMTQDDLVSLAKEMKIEGFANCLATQNVLSIQQDMKYARQVFWFKSLPANVLLDTKTGNYVLIPWYYETKDVLTAVQWMLDIRK